MRAVVIYESIYGNTHLVADAIAAGLGWSDVEVVPVARASAALVLEADLVVVGGPTHVHGMSRERTRTSAIETAHQPGHEMPLDPDAAGEGLREWFEHLGTVATPGAAFDTRMSGPPLLTGRASKGIAKELEAHGFGFVAEPVSFLVTRDNHLEPDEVTRAREWGAELATAIGVAP